MISCEHPVQRPLVLPDNTCDVESIVLVIRATLLNTLHFYICSLRFVENSR